MRTAAEALEEHGFTGEQLLKLSRKAAQDALRRRGAFLDQQRFDNLADYLLEVGVSTRPATSRGTASACRRSSTGECGSATSTGSALRSATNRNRVSTRFPRGGFVPLNELDGPYWEDGYDEVDERLSAV